MLAALAEGKSEVVGFLPSTDCEATLTAFQNMGVQIEHIDYTHVCVNGVGLKGLRTPNEVLDMGNSGTAMRLMSGIS